MTVLKNIICVLLAFLSFALVRAAPLKDVIMPRTLLSLSLLG